MEHYKLSSILVLLAGVLSIAFASINLYSLLYSRAQYEELIREIANNTAPAPGVDVVEFVYNIALLINIWYIVAGVLLILSSILIYTGKPRRVRVGGILAIVFSVLSLGSLAVVVTVLGIVGGALALTWKPQEKPETAITEPETGEAVI